MMMLTYKFNHGAPVMIELLLQYVTIVTVLITAENTFLLQC